MAKILTVEAVSKRFRIHHNRSGSLKESMVRWVHGHRNKNNTFWALDNISFSVEQGQAFGIIGHNGAGKSTLLRLLCGLGRPTSGQIYRSGNISGLLELGSGFHPDMTGRENLMTGGILCGLTRRQTLEKQEEIISFAELEEFIDQPVRTYSNGMYLRLAFATAIHFDPDALIIDEVLAVGDARFQKKCIEWMAAFRAKGKTTILTSHEQDQIRNLCDEVLVLEEGRVVMQGDPESALDCYNDLMRQRTERKAERLFSKEDQPDLTVTHGTRMGTQEASICAVQLYDIQSRSVDTLVSGGNVTIKLEYNLTKPLSDMVLVLDIHNETNVKCFETCISSVYKTFGSLVQHGNFICHLPELPLLPGLYYINVGLYPTDCSYIYDYHWQMHPLHITGKDRTYSEYSGVVSLRPIWSFMDRDKEKRTFRINTQSKTNICL